MPEMKQTLTMGFRLEMVETERAALLASLVDVMSGSELDSYLRPQQSDYVRVPVRALSAGEVQGGIINFGHDNGKALQAAVALFNGLTVLKDHNFSVNNWIGHTENAYWDNSTPNVPPGVNSMLVIDTKADPKTARGLISGELNSVSVTVSFDYEKSHPDMSDMDFYMQMGDTVDGKKVQALVTKVTRLYEISVVWQGADPYAKRIGNDGRISVPGTPSNAQLSASAKETTMDFKKLLASLGLTLENPTEETFTAHLKEKLAAGTKAATDLQTATTENTSLKAQVVTITTQLTEKATALTTAEGKLTVATAELETLKPRIAAADAYLKDQRDEALRLYNLVEGTKATEPMRLMIGGASLEVAKGFIASYQERADQIAPAKCTACGATNSLTRRASQSTETEPVTGTVVVAKEEIQRRKAAVTNIHG